LTEWRSGLPLFRATIVERSGRRSEACVQIERRDLAWSLRYRGAAAEVLVVSARAAELMASLPPKARLQSRKRLLSPMPGMLTELRVAVGDQVQVGQPLAIVEAMKMQNVLLAEYAGKVVAIHALPGETVAAEQEIMEFE
jgi:propionyl-CoA carboxylase alpha chain